MTRDKIRLTQMSTSSGWGAKIGPETLAQVLCKLPKYTDEKLIVGNETSDDAAVYKISDELAMIQSVDYFTPVVDDPYTFGQIAAANSLSDIYAMGGEPKIALSIIGFPSCLNNEVMEQILKGGIEKVAEAGAIVAGGHSIKDEEPKYGLCVTGFVHPEKIFKNHGAKPGDILVITKPIGLGIINTAIKAELASEIAYNKAVKTMVSLNRKAKLACDNVEVSSCTDITGFGLMGHAVEVAENSNVTFKIQSKSVPILKEAVEYAEMGLIPAGAYENRYFFESKVKFHDISETMQDIFYDPQTSGGLLITIDKKYKEILLDSLDKQQIDTEYNIIGEVVEKSDAYIEVY